MLYMKQYNEVSKQATMHKRVSHQTSTTTKEQVYITLIKNGIDSII